jgi:hypothetical protein
MSRNATRSLTIAAAAVAASLAAGPAFAATSAKPTGLTLKAAKSTVAPKQREKVVGTLKQGNRVLAGQAVTLEKRAPGARSFTVVTTRRTDRNGHTFFVVAPGTRKGAKEQYELVFAGTKAYKPSHSSIVTLTVR